MVLKTIIVLFIGNYDCVIMTTIILNVLMCNYNHYSEVESPIELHGAVIENKCYVQENVKKDLDTAIIKPSIDENATIIANDYVHVHAIKQIKTEYRQKFHDSPLARHTPKIITHPVKGNLNVLVQTPECIISITWHGLNWVPGTYSRAEGLAEIPCIRN